MGVITFPAATAGGIKSVQRGSAAGAGNVTITAVDISKSFVTVFGTSSSGTVAGSANINAANGSFAGQIWAGNVSNHNPETTNFSMNSTNLAGGSNNLVAAVVQGYLSNSTTLVVSGACRWEVVEFN